MPSGTQAIGRRVTYADYCLSLRTLISITLGAMKSPIRPCRSDLAVARVVRATRSRANLSQEALAELAGLHRTYISLLERGRRSPTLTTLERIAHALSVAPPKLLGLIAEAAEELVEADAGPQRAGSHTGANDAAAAKSD
jgi:transcriptional regulator with XRE-family HTH domain